MRRAAPFLRKAWHSIRFLAHVSMRFGGLSTHSKSQLRSRSLICTHLGYTINSISLRLVYKRAASTSAFRTTRVASTSVHLTPLCSRCSLSLCEELCRLLHHARYWLRALKPLPVPCFDSEIVRQDHRKWRQQTSLKVQQQHRLRTSLDRLNRNLTYTLRPRLLKCLRYLRITT